MFLRYDRFLSESVRRIATESREGQRTTGVLQRVKANLKIK